MENFQIAFNNAVKKIKTKIINRHFETLNNIYISKNAVLNNFDLIQKLNPDCSIFPVLKSNAYGHGIKEIAKILNERNVDYIVVDSYYEFLQIQKVNKNPILLIGYTMPSNFKNMDFSYITLMISDIQSLIELGKLNKKIKIHLKIDTGMNRQGIYENQIIEFLNELKKYKKIVLEGICTHLADADNIDNSFSKIQINKFINAIKTIEENGYNLKYKHFSNSAGSIKKFGDNSINAIRLGISLYGINPLNSKDPYYKKLELLKLALKFESTLIAKKFIKKGEYISYNCTYKTKKDTIIGIIPVGYYEGIPRNLSSNFCFTYKGKDAPILGRVCMNLTIIDLSNIKNIEVGAKITIISNKKNSSNCVYELSKRSSTIPYESFSKLGESIRRTIVI